MIDSGCNGTWFKLILNHIRYPIVTITRYFIVTVCPEPGTTENAHTSKTTSPTDGTEPGTTGNAHTSKTPTCSPTDGTVDYIRLLTSPRLIIVSSIYITSTPTIVPTLLISFNFHRKPGWHTKFIKIKNPPLFQSGSLKRWGWIYN